jgi:hypothetical protein
MRALIVVVVLLVAGCGASTQPSPPYADSASRQPTTEPAGEPTLEPTPEPEARVDPTVIAQGFTADTETDSVSYAVVIENPNSTWVPRYVDVSITFLDAKGTELTTETQSITGMLPESETAVAGEVPQAGRATAMEVQISNLNSLPGQMRSSLEEAGRYDYEGVETLADESGGITTTGVVRSGFESEQINVPIHAVYYSSAGSVIGGAVTIVDRVPSGNEAPFEASTLATVPDITETRVFGQIGFGS